MSFLLRLLGLEKGTDVARVVDSAWYASSPLSQGLLVGLVLFGLALAAINWLPQLALRTRVRTMTFLLRLAMLGLLLVALARIEWRVSLAVREPQRWTVLLDDSGSMATVDGGGTQNRFAAARRDLDSLAECVGSDVQLSVHTLSGGLPGDRPTEGPTPLASAISRQVLEQERSDRLILLTDGRDSDDRDLSPLGEELKLRDTRLTVVLYGSQAVPADRGITAEPERGVIRLGEELVVHGGLTGPAGEAAVTVKEDGKPLKTIEVAGQTGRFEFRHRPKQKGQHVYTFELPQTDASAANNATRFSVQVVEEKINVLLVEGFPRFEFKLFKSVLEVDPLVNLVSMCQLPGGGVYVQGEPLHRNPEQGLIASQVDLFKYDVIVLRDVPRNLFRAGGDTGESRMRLLVEFVTKRGGGLMICGGQDVYRAGGYEDSPLAEVLPFDLSAHYSGDAQFEGLFFADVSPAANSHPLLRLLADPTDNHQRWNALPKLDGSNNVGRFKPLATPLLTRKVQLKTKGDTVADQVAPVLGVMAVGEGKVVGASVDTLWRWQLQSEFEDPPLTMLLANIIRYLAPPPDRRPDRPDVMLADAAPQVGQEVLLATELRDANFEPVRNADLVVTVTQPDGNSWRLYPRDLPEEPGHYAYRVPIDQPGAYKVHARHGKFESTREFLAGAAAGEFSDLSANVEGMRGLTAAAEGELVSGSQDDWLARLDRSPAQRTVQRELEIWNSPAMLLLFLALVSADCYLRKRQGLA